VYRRDVATSSNRCKANRFAASRVDTHCASEKLPFSPGPYLGKLTPIWEGTRLKSVKRVQKRRKEKNQVPRVHGQRGIKKLEDPEDSRAFFFNVHPANPTGAMGL